MGLHEVFIHSQCITYSRWQSERPQFGETGRSTSTGAKQCTAVDGGSSKTDFRHLKKSVSVFFIRIFSLLYLAVRQPFPMGNALSFQSHHRNSCVLRGKISVSVK